MQLLTCSAATPASSASNKPHDFHSLLNAHSPPQSIQYKLNINSGHQKLFKLTPKLLFVSLHIYSHIHIYIYIGYTYVCICILYNKLYFTVLFIFTNPFMHILHSSSLMPSGMITWKGELSANWFLNRKIIKRVKLVNELCLTFSGT